MSQLTFDGRVAIVTGAGSGIGREVALCLARRGARVLVNDIGDELDPAGRSEKRAQRVVDEIELAGGTAVVSYEAVGTHEGARAIVAAALKSFGRVDMLVNSAGISLTGRITDHTEVALDHVIQVDLLGAYALVRAVWSVMAQQRSGSILSMSSNAALGIGMNAPYAIAKAGLIGLTLDAAQEGIACGIRVNAFMPLAYTRMAAGIPDAQFLAWLQQNFPAAKVAEAAAYFLHPACEVTGRIFSVGGGCVAAVAFLKGRGFFDRNLTAESLREHLAETLDLEGGKPLVTQSDEMKDYFGTFPWTGRPGMDRLTLREDG